MRRGLDIKGFLGKAGYPHPPKPHLINLSCCQVVWRKNLGGVVPLSVCLDPIRGLHVRSMYRGDLPHPCQDKAMMKRSRMMPAVQNPEKTALEALAERHPRAEASGRVI